MLAGWQLLFFFPFVNDFMKNKGLCGDRHVYLLCDKTKGTSGSPNNIFLCIFVSTQAQHYLFYNQQEKTFHG